VKQAQKSQAMKISKSLLQAITVGLSLSSMTTSCTKDLYEVDPTPEVDAENQTDHLPSTGRDLSWPFGEEDPKSYDCPACGLG
jgi:hypothetical protein